VPKIEAIPNARAHPSTEKEPPVRKDGRCPVCGKPRPENAVAVKDPFCSAACCRKHYRVVDTGVVAESEPEAVVAPLVGPT